jgi:hypothetical protein
MSEDTCPSCGMHFWSPLHRDSHKTIYPDHFDKKLPQKTMQKDALPEARMKRAKKARDEE